MENCHHSKKIQDGDETAPTLVGGSVADPMYTCPMHPEIRQMGPGGCPICGMALEPEITSGEEGENLELKDFRRRF